MQGAVAAREEGANPRGSFDVADVAANNAQEGAAAVRGELDKLSRERARGGCRYPSHRASDWQNGAGRLVCGICHPRVEAKAKPGVT